MEIASRQGGRIGGGGGDGQSNHKLIELEKKLIEDNLDKMRQADDKQKLAQKLSALREKFRFITILIDIMTWLKKKLNSNKS